MNVEEVAKAESPAEEKVVPMTRSDPEFCLDCNPTDDGQPGPAERIIFPADVIEISPEDDTVYVIGTKDGKVTRIGGLQGMPNLKVRDSFHTSNIYSCSHHSIFQSFRP